MTKRALKIINEKKKFFTRQNATLRYNHILILHAMLGIQTYRCHWIILKKLIGCQLRIGLFNALRWWLTILKITSLLYTCQIYTLNVSPIVKARRSVDSFVEPIYVKEISRKLISYFGSTIWNGLDRNIKTTNSFKHALKIQFIEN